MLLFVRGREVLVAYPYSDIRMTSGEDGEASIALLPTAGFAFWGFQGGTVGLLSRSGDPDLCLAGGQSCRLHWPCSGAGNSKRLAHFFFFFGGGSEAPKGLRGS